MTQIRDVRNAYCPMGCGEHVHLMPSGLLCCLAPHCPRPGAAGEILADRESEHVVNFTALGWTLRHPLKERLDDALMLCELNDYLGGYDTAPVTLGRYRMTMTDGEPDFDAV